MLLTGMISRSFSSARNAFASVCAWSSCAASTRRSTFARLQGTRHLVREVDMAGRVDQVELMTFPGHTNGLGLDRDPRSRSSSIESSTCSRISRSLSVSVTSRMRSARVDLPWSMCATIEKLRMRSSFTRPLYRTGGGAKHPGAQFAGVSRRR